jgi:hypothetical protein
MPIRYNSKTKYFKVLYNINYSDMRRLKTDELERYRKIHFDGIEYYIHIQTGKIYLYDEFELFTFFFDV